MSVVLKFVVILHCYYVSAEFGDVATTLATMKRFAGAEHWSEEYLQHCDSPPPLNRSLSCYSYVLNYQRLNSEIISEDPFLIVYRDFVSQQNVNEFLTAIKDRTLVQQEVLNNDDTSRSELHSSRQANGTWIEHQEIQGVAKMFRRAVAMLPFVNFDHSEHWQQLTDCDVSEFRGRIFLPRRLWIDFARDYLKLGKRKHECNYENLCCRYCCNQHSTKLSARVIRLQILSYYPGGHYVPHYDYITYTSSQSDWWLENFGNRFATFLLVLETADRGGGTIFPELNATIQPSPGDVIFWANVDSTKNLELRTLHGACPIWEGKKVAATLWIRFKDQDILYSPLKDGRFDLEKLIHPRPEFLGMSPVYKD